MMTIALLSSLMLMPLAADEAPPFPRVQAIPLPMRQIAFEVDGTEIARYHFDASYYRPFVFPLIGPAGEDLTRIGQPTEPRDHGHHLSVWVSHQDVNGVNFWEDGEGRVVHEHIESITDGPESAIIITTNTWRDAKGRVLLDERRTTSLTTLARDERYLDTRIELAPRDGAVTFGKTNFGFFAFRVAKTMGVTDGGGQITNSEGAINEENVMAQHARWVDYTGPVAPDTANGLAVFDHPDNPRFPAAFHVRNNGWIGASFCMEEPYELAQGQTLTLKYRLYAHDSDATLASIDAHWQRFAGQEEKP